MNKAISKLTAYCYRSGQIGFARGRAPDGSIAIASAPARVLRDAVAGSARLAYDGKTWLVPGVPEAVSTDEALRALSHYAKRLRLSVARREQEVAHV